MRIMVATLGAVLALASPVAAQRVDGKGVPYRAWDIDAGVGFHSMVAADRDIGTERRDYENWDPSWATSLGVGYFWNSHLKTEAGATFIWPYHSTTGAQEVLDGGQVVYTYTSGEIRQTQVALAATYQFFENAFAHPYVSAGARFGLLDIDGFESYRTTYDSNTRRQVTSVVPADDSFDVRVRPYVAFGSKSYFNERTYIRPEMVLGFNSRGIGQFGARLAIGVDF